MGPRQKQILSILVDDYVKEFKPISSGFLVDRHSLDFSPATVRNELAGLLAEGYLRKIYFSSGSVPTNKAYRFIVKEILEAESSEIDTDKEYDFNSVTELVEFLSQELGLLTAAIDEDYNFFIDGIEELFEQPDFKTKKQYESLGRLVEFLRETKQGIFERAAELSPSVFIGKENPIYKEIDELSWLVGSSREENNFPAVMISIGPARMSYKKNWQTFRSSSRHLSKIKRFV
jgi:transcriptional regulator of heat shock response